MNTNALGSWRQFVVALFRTPLRAIITIIALIIILESGIVFVLLGLLINALLYVLVVFAILAGLFGYIISGGKRH